MAQVQVQNRQQELDRAVQLLEQALGSQSPPKASADESVRIQLQPQAPPTKKRKKSSAAAVLNRNSSPKRTGTLMNKSDTSNVLSDLPYTTDFTSQNPLDNTSPIKTYVPLLLTFSQSLLFFDTFFDFWISPSLEQQFLNSSNLSSTTTTTSTPPAHSCLTLSFASLLVQEPNHVEFH